VKRLPVVLIGACLVVPAIAQTRPATRPAGLATATEQPDAPKPIDKSLLEQALARLKAGEHKEAIAAAQTFQKTLPRLGMNFDVNWANANHVLALSYLELGQPDKAREVMDAVIKSGKSNRSVVLNSAVIDIAVKSQLQRGLKSLRTFVLAHTEDETAVNLLGTAIDIASKESPAPNLADATADYQKANAALERKRPGYHHWGTDWIGNQEFQQTETKRKYQQREVDSVRTTLADYTLQLKDAQSRLNALTNGSAGIYYTPQARAQQIEYARNEVSRVQLRVDDAKTRLDRALEDLPRPSWPPKVAPVEIELLN
jgi:hypothetical protein